jgi:hypothetical protein
MDLPEPSCPMGYTESDLRAIFGDEFDVFMHWMRGQTMGICDGKQYHHDRKHTEDCMIISPLLKLADPDAEPHTEDSEFDWYCGYTGTGYYEGSECAGNPHGVVAYISDLKRYILGLPVID